MIDFANSGTPFNMAMLYYQGLGALWDRKDEAYTHGDAFGYYLCLEAMYRKIAFKPNKNECRAIRDLLDPARDLLKDSPPVMREADRKREFLRMPVVIKLEEADSLIVDVMARYNMIFPKVASSGLDRITKRYNLKDGGDVSGGSDA